MPSTSIPGCDRVGWPVALLHAWQQGECSGAGGRMKCCLVKAVQRVKAGCLGTADSWGSHVPTIGKLRQNYENCT
jgi:hypothetical protein